MESLTISGGGVAGATEEVVPGQRLRFYFDKGSPAPSAGTLTLTHRAAVVGSASASLAKDLDGDAISFDLSSADEGEVTVIARTSGLTVGVNGGTASAVLNYAIVPIQ